MSYLACIQKDQSPELAVIVEEACPAQRLLVSFLIDVCMSRGLNKAKTGPLLGRGTEC